MHAYQLVMVGTEGHASEPFVYVTAARGHSRSSQMRAGCYSTPPPPATAGAFLIQQANHITGTHRGCRCRRRQKTMSHRRCR